jgi:hypothetical protein
VEAIPFPASVYPAGGSESGSSSYNFTCPYIGETTPPSGPIPGDVPKPNLSVKSAWLVGVAVPVTLPITVPLIVYPSPTTILPTMFTSPFASIPGVFNTLDTVFPDFSILNFKS